MPKPTSSLSQPWRWDKSSRQAQRRRVYELVAGKCKVQEPLTKGEEWVQQHVGSKGWHTRGYLPHYDSPGTMQFLTFRLSDAMPEIRRSEWETLLRIPARREQQIRLEKYLDSGFGECWLRKPDCARAVETALLEMDGKMYRLAAWVIMPNHAHVLVELWTRTLGELCKAWKGASARAVNKALGKKGSLWQPDYWDHYIRDEEHFRKAVKYIENNPVKAGLVRQASDWPHSSASASRIWVGGNRFTSGHLESPAWRRLEVPVWATMGPETAKGRGMV